RPVDVVLGYDSAAEYEAGRDFFGATVGRYANRIAGARFALGGREYRLTANEGPNTLHGGEGFDKRVFDFYASESEAELTRLSPHMEDGFPGDLDVTVRYELGENEVRLTYTAVSDRDTVVNLTNHSYFDLSGGRGAAAHVLRLASGAYTEPDAALIPTGRILPVDGTRFDLREAKPLTDSFDHNFVLGAPGELREAAELCSPDTGICMRVYTTMPGLQLYTGGAMSSRRGKGGAALAPGAGLCLETQFYPDSPNRPEFPSALLRAGEKYEHTTIWRFSVR
ncbi:MAG: galactose mutarotase, partial [Oscillospiraceae bacterium]|nr:galactose mutarotase [Oscillospiraceae bacterium]